MAFRRVLFFLTTMTKNQKNAAKAIPELYLVVKIFEVQYFKSIFGSEL